MNIFFVSDTHFGHENFLDFEDENGKLIRPFACVEAMDEMMVERWNSVVRPGDRVYHLGDVAFGKNTAARILPRLNGSKRLILGNHDDLRDEALHRHFTKIRLWRSFKDEGFVITHMPLRDEGIRHEAINVHGHIHEKPAPSPRHINICVEQTCYTPVALEMLRETVAARKELLG